MDVQAVFGPIPKIVGKGHCAQVSSSQPFLPHQYNLRAFTVWVTLTLVYSNTHLVQYQCHWLSNNVGSGLHGHDLCLCTLDKRYSVTFPVAVL